jgi:enoyl-CoA hydratase
MSADILTIEREDAIAIVTLNRPEAMNALSIALRAHIAEAFTELAADDSVRAIVLTGAGERAFTAGLDLKELGQTGLQSGETRAKTDPVTAMNACRKPIIGAINGVAITGGFEIALACDVLVASTKARFADTHARVGIIPGWGLSQKLSRVVGIYRAKSLSLTGNFLDAKTAEMWGLVSHVVAPEELLPLAKKLAHDMTSIPPTMLENYKQLIDEGFAMNFGDSMKLEAQKTRDLNAGVTGDAVETARLKVLERGRAQ